MLHLLLGYELPGQRGNVECLYAGHQKSEVDRIRAENVKHGSFMICSGVNGIRKSNLNFNPAAEAKAKAEAEAKAKADEAAAAQAKAEAEAKAKADEAAAAQAKAEADAKASAPSAPPDKEPKKK